MEKLYEVCFSDGTACIINESGILIRDTEGCNGDGFEIYGIYVQSTRAEIRWREVIAMLSLGVKLSDDTYLHTGQVEGETITSITLYDPNSTGGRDVSGYTGTNNVYCEPCDTEYEVRVDLDGYVPTFCTFCGTSGLLTKEEY